MLKTDIYNFFIFEIIILVMLFKCMDMKRQCIKGMTTPGYTIPYDDIVIEYGNPLDITCILNEEYQKLNPNVTSEDLYFERAGHVISKDLVRVLNTSSIHLHVDQPEISVWVYNCKLRNSGGVCLNTVYVGTKPVLEDDFVCTGFNYENLTCSWTTPFNPAYTSYTLRYSSGGRNSSRPINDCPNLHKPTASLMSCTWTLTTQPSYNQTEDDIDFVLTAKNQFGEAELNKTISHFKRVIPAAPENLTWNNVTSGSAVLKWSVSNTMQMFPPGVQYRIVYKSEFDENEWQMELVLLSGSQNKARRISYNLTNLTYAFAQYEIGVAMRSAAADPSDDTMWSKYSYTTLKTKSRVPGRPPKTTTGSFESILTGNSFQRSREVYIYWQQVPDKLKNGKQFSYEVEAESNRPLRPVEVTPSFAKFSNLSVTQEYIFNIWSTNSVGRSETYSSVMVPQQSEDIRELAHFTKLIRNDHTYELSWDPPGYPINNYTIFACMYERDRPYQCAGFLNWKVIPSGKVSYVVKTPEPKKIYQFAISANGDEFCSGMVWADCTVISSQVGNKLKNVWIIQISTSHILLSWKLDCSERIGGIEGFSVRYCENEKFTSKKEWTELYFNGSSVEHANITNLSPYTKYIFSITKLTKNGEFRQRSDFIIGTTLEAAPTPPTDLKETEITNSSITIAWNLPISTNGELRHYIIIRNSYIYKIEADKQQFTINNLTSYTKYNISLIACTVSCSRPSSALIVKTKGGFPGKINQPGVTFQNDSITLVEWDRPKYPNGNCDLYEIFFKERRRYENKTLAIMNTTGTWHIIEDCGSGGKYNTFFISVRAVNILNGTRYEGPWSDELQSFCRNTSTNAWIWALGPSLLLVGFLVYLGRRIYYNYQKMRDIEVKLPPGLTAFDTVPEKTNHLPVIEEMPLKKKVTGKSSTKVYIQNNLHRYIPMRSRTSKSSLGNKINPSSNTEYKEEYIAMSTPNIMPEVQTRSNEIGYVQVGDISSLRAIPTSEAVLDAVTPSSGYVTVGDISSILTRR